MAALQYASTDETTNLSRASRVLLGPCTDQLRDVLRHHVPEPHFRYIIRQNRNKITHLTKPQKELILPRSGHYSGNYFDMDISLLYTLLRNICNIPPHMNGWGNDPNPNDVSLSANIERIRNSRNVVGHSLSYKVSYTEFNHMWSTIRLAVVEIDKYLNNNSKYEKAVDFLRSETMDPEMEKEFEEQLHKQMEEETETRKLIEDTKQEVKDQAEIIKKLLDKQNTHSAQIADLSEKAQVKFDETSDVSKLKQKILEINDNMARNIQLSQVQMSGDTLPIEQLFSSVIVKEDSKIRCFPEFSPLNKSSEAEKDPKRKDQDRKEVKTPDDLLIKNHKMVRNVYMLGDAAHGKTTYCMWLINTWCNAEQLVMRPMTEWQNALNQFDFVFYLPLRHVDPSTTNVTDMICKYILGRDTTLYEVVKYVLFCDRYRCFILMDGIDEQKSKKGMPYIDNMSNCVLFITMRPWKFADVTEFVNYNDRVVEILGLDDKSIEAVIQKVLIHYFKMQQGSDNFNKKYKEIIDKLENKTLKAFIKVPLLAVVCVQIWYAGKHVNDSMVSFYTAMINMLIQRAHVKHQTRSLLFQKTNPSLPKLLSARKNITQNLSVLQKLGKIAYEGLLSNQLQLVFQKDELEKEIDEEELQFVLDVGLISQTEVYGVLEQKVCVHFFHESLQEYLAAIYLSSQDKTVDNFLTSLSNVKAIMELSNVILFICGMCPSLGRIILEHIVSVTDNDKEIHYYRKSPWPENNTVIEMYKLQISWNRELQYGQTNRSDNYYVSDVNLGRSSYSGSRYLVRSTRELLSTNITELKSLWLCWVTDVEEPGLTNKELNEFLSKTQNFRSLVMMYICGVQSDWSLHTIAVPSLRSLYLMSVGIREIDSVFPPFIRNMGKIKVLYLYDVRLGSRDLGLREHMTQLQKVTLCEVKMTPLGWENFVNSIIDIHHQFIVHLWFTNIDTASVSTIRISPHFNVTKQYKSKTGNFQLDFTKL